jgi:chlorobactene glucosyltransferase
VAAWWWPLPALAWAAPLAGFIRRDRRLLLESVPAAAGEPLTVIIPARNESRNIARLVREILASSYEPLELLVVDDRSDDDTAAQARMAMAGDPRARVIRGAALPDGWFGKPWACAQGARAASGQLLLFTDADTHHHPELLGRAAGALRQDRADLLTVLTYQRCESFWERVVMPQILLVLGLRFSPARINSATRPHQVVANGQFILVDRDAYQGLGGHGAVADQVVEDLALAQAFVSARRRIRMYDASALCETRMYTSLRELVEGWSKNLFIGARTSVPDHPLLRTLAPFSLLLAFAFWLVPWAGLAPVTTRATAIAAITVATGCWAVIYRGLRLPMRYALAWPLGAAVAFGITLRSVRRGFRTVEWRGRRYRIGRDGVRTAHPGSGS